MKSWTPVIEPPLYRAPRESVVAVESAQRLEIGDFDHRSHPGTKAEMQEAARRRGPRHAGECGAGRVGQFVFVLMHVGGEQEELVVFDAESPRWLADATFPQDNELPAFSELPTDHGPLLQSDVIDGLHRG